MQCAYNENPQNSEKKIISKTKNLIIIIIKLLYLETFYSETNNICESKYKYVFSISVVIIWLI